MLEKMKEMIADQLSVLVMALEEEYGIEIPSEELESLTTVGAIIDYLKAHGVEE